LCGNCLRPDQPAGADMSRMTRLEITPDPSSVLQKGKPLGESGISERFAVDPVFGAYLADQGNVAVISGADVKCASFTVNRDPALRRDFTVPRNRRPICTPPELSPRVKSARNAPFVVMTSEPPAMIQEICRLLRSHEHD